MTTFAENGHFLRASHIFSKVLLILSAQGAVVKSIHVRNKEPFIVVANWYDRQGFIDFNNYTAEPLERDGWEYINISGCQVAWDNNAEASL